LRQQRFGKIANDLTGSSDSDFNAKLQQRKERFGNNNGHILPFDQVTLFFQLYLD
jgi:hypothetical protein